MKEPETLELKAQAQSTESVVNKTNGQHLTLLSGLPFSCRVKVVVNCVFHISLWFFIALPDTNVSLKHINLLCLFGAFKVSLYATQGRFLKKGRGKKEKCRGKVSE